MIHHFAIAVALREINQNNKRIREKNSREKSQQTIKCEERTKQTMKRKKFNRRFAITKMMNKDEKRLK